MNKSDRVRGGPLRNTPGGEDRKNFKLYILVLITSLQSTGDPDAAMLSD